MSTYFSHDGDKFNSFETMINDELLQHIEL